MSPAYTVQFIFPPEQTDESTQAVSTDTSALQNMRRQYKQDAVLLAISTIGMTASVASLVNLSLIDTENAHNTVMAGKLICGLIGAGAVITMGAAARDLVEDCKIIRLMRHQQVARQEAQGLPQTQQAHQTGEIPATHVVELPVVIEHPDQVFSLGVVDPNPS